MGYNSLGNITFFGVGMYVSAIVQISMFYDGGMGEYTSAMGSIKPEFTDSEYFWGLGLGIIAAGLVGLLLSVIFSSFMFGLRGPYFAIGSLGLAIAAAELTITVDYVGGASGISMPLFPGDIEFRSTFFYILCFALAIAAHFPYCAGCIRHSLVLRSTRSAMMRTRPRLWAFRHLSTSVSDGVSPLSSWVQSERLPVTWSGFIDKEVAYPIPTFGIFMVAMVLLGGKGTLWGPVLGAIIFHVIKETTWTYLLNLQWVALGLILIVNIVYFQQGIMGWLQSKFPERFGIVVDQTEVRQSDSKEAA